MRFKRVIVLLSFLTLSQALFAESWSAQKNDHSGDIVHHKNRYYLASYGNRNLQPIDNRFPWDGWITISNDHREHWNAHKIYQADSVVTFNDEHYIGRGVAPESPPKPAFTVGDLARRNGE